MLRAIAVCLSASILILPAHRAVAEETVGDQVVEYNRDVRPILAENCFFCHGTDGATREAGLRLDIREDAVDFGAVVPGESDSSTIVERIFLSDDDDLRMPPVDSHKSLTEAEKQTLVRWINQGAQYQPHWSFIAPAIVPPAEAKTKDWAINPIDDYILSAMESKGLSPAKPADRHALARRAALDITGLPPEPELLKQFLSDSSPDAYDKYLDQLFASPSWGEHRGRYWLDYARYADTHGIHFDNYREMWSYRDWVIDAFNQNMPYDQFSIEQLAGDLLPDPTMDQKIATGFNRCNMTTNEGGIIDEEYKVLYARDRTETTAAVWMGLTAGCAVCHDHKFDPISAKDFYSLSAFFNNTTQPVRDGNIPDTPPKIVVPTREDRAAWDEVQRSVAEVTPKLDAITEEARATWSADSLSPIRIAESLPQNERLILHAPLDEASGERTRMMIGKTLVPVATPKAVWQEGKTAANAFMANDKNTIRVGDVANFNSDDAFTIAAWVQPRTRKVSGAVVAKMDGEAGLRGWDVYLDGDRLAVHLIHQWPSAAIKLITKQTLPFKTWTHIAVTHDGSGLADGIRLFINGVEQTDRTKPNDSLERLPTTTSAPLTIGGRVNGSSPKNLLINDVRVYETEFSADDLLAIQEGTVALHASTLPPDSHDAETKDVLLRWYLGLENETYRSLSSQLRDLQKQKDAIGIRGTVALIMQEQDSPAIAHILDRGEYDLKLDEVPADVPEQLPGLGDLPRNRLGLAQWLFRDDNPLTNRVTVNRFWQEVFGTGLVRTAADFGVMGEPPSHPELLDYLAITFRETGYDVQALFRLMLTSQTYRQSGIHSELANEIDTENRYLSHGPRFRMHGEMVRDMALWSSGLLADAIGGPSVRPYQPEGVWEAVAMPNSNTHFYKRDDGEKLYRRSMYSFWKRSAPPASMEIMGAPNREVCTVTREQTNTPLQALVTLNDPQFVEAARVTATRVLKQDGLSDDDRLDWIAMRLLSRSWSDAETKILTQSLDRLTKHYADNIEQAEQLIAIGQAPADDSIDAGQLAAWTMLANQIMNLDEVLCK